MDNRNYSSTGIIFSGALFIAFLVLKLTPYISWSWVWVCAPLWIPLAFVALFALAYIIALILSMLKF